MSRVPLLLFTAVLVALWLAGPAVGQVPTAPQDPGVRDVTRTFAITGARVVQAPGQELPRATVVIRDGLIVAVGPDAAVPFDADVIEGDTLVVYAGFIDALGDAAIRIPETPGERVTDPADPPRDRSGILPDRRAHLYLDPERGNIEQLRRLGFAAAHVAPAAGMLSGQSAVILLAGDRPEEMVLVPEAALVARFQGATGIYPSTPMAVAAVLTQLFRQTAQAGLLATEYAVDPTGRRRPVYDPVAEALRPALERRQPIYFVAASPLEAHRALRLARELDFDLVLAGLPESSMLIERLQAQEVPVLAPLALPDVVEQDTLVVPTDPERDLAAHLGGEIFVTEHRTRSYLDVDDEQRVLHERRFIAAGLYERNPLTLDQAGVPFAFASLGQSPGTFRASLRRMIAAGLSRETALAALTTVPATLLGLDRTLGTVEPGRMANLVITDGDYFDQATRVRYVFVDGRRFRVEEVPPADDPDAEITVIGRWDFSVVTPDATFSGEMHFTGTPDEPSATLLIPQVGTVAVTDIRIDGNRLSFVVPETPLGRAEVSGIVAGGAFDGTITVPGVPPLTFSATLRPN